MLFTDEPISVLETHITKQNVLLIAERICQTLQASQHLFRAINHVNLFMKVILILAIHRRLVHPVNL